MENILQTLTMNTIPPEGTCGPLELIMHRGIKPKHERLHPEFASDPGDYGSGEYWTDCLKSAKKYGEVISKTIKLDRVYNLPMEECRELINKYNTCQEMDTTRRLENVARLTEYFKSKGYEAVLIYGYEDFTQTSICVFSNEEGIPKVT